MRTSRPRSGFRVKFPRLIKPVSTRQLLITAIALLLVPIVVLGCLFVRLKFHHVDLTMRERDGVQLLRHALPALSAVAAAHGAWPGRSARLDPTRAERMSRPTQIELAALAEALAAPTDDRDALEARLLRLIARIGDDSTLILDSELASNYVMSALVERTPALIRQLGATTRKLTRIDAGASDFIPRQTEALIELRQLAEMFAALEKTYESTLTADRDGRIAAALDRPLFEVRDVIRAFDGRLVSIWADQFGMLTLIDRSRVEAASERSHAALVAFADAAATELDRLLADRIDAMRRSLWLGLALTLAMTVLAVALSHRALASLVNRLDDRIVFLADHDNLTGLVNRRVLQDRIDRLLALGGEPRSFALVSLDLDRFKAVNDTLGHPVGDRLLRLVAQRLSATTRAGDLVSRVGGDEFAIVVSSENVVDAARALAERTIELLSQPFEIDGHVVSIGTSVGIAIAVPGETVRDAVMQMADIALYRAKADGRGCYRFFEPGMDVEVQERRALEIDLRAAVAREQFVLHFQPLARTLTSEIVSFEALLRWQHPVRGLVAPDRFIPLAEELGVIDEIGAWVLGAACRAASRWPEHIRIAVNVSSVQFKSRKLVATVRDALARSGLNAERLELEITETALLTDTEAVLETLFELKRLGVRISMDDFGTGYSSLGYLRRFPFDKLKIDRSFVWALDNGPEPTAIVRAVTDLANTLGICTTAEGVETERQRETLGRLNCAEVQGYLISRPVPEAQIAALLGVVPETDRAAA